MTEAYYGKVEEAVTGDGPPHEAVRDKLRNFFTARDHRFVSTDAYGDGWGRDSKKERRLILYKVIETIARAGRLFDFGKFPSERLRNCPGVEAVRLPYEHCLYIWRGAATKGIDATHIAVLTSDDEGRINSFIVLQSMNFRQGPVLLLCASITLEYMDDGTIDLMMEDSTASTEHKDAAIKVGDTCLLWLTAMTAALNDDRVKVTRVPEPDRLNKIRAKKGRLPIPAYWKIPKDAYVTTLQDSAGGSSRAEGGGTHASPRPHMRRAHNRRLEDGRIVWVRPASVNDYAQHLTRGREFYRVKA